MKKITKTASILILLIILFFGFRQISYAWDDCVFDQVNDQYPGDCARYVDTDHDGICDHSQPAPEDRVTVSAAEQKNEVKGNNYYPLRLSLIVLIAYGLSYLLTKLHVIKVSQHRQFWNVLLTLSFLLVGISGILLIIKISYGIVIHFPLSLLFWHVETGLVFTIMAIFHLLWHLPYYKNMLKIK